MFGTVLLIVTLRVIPEAPLIHARDSATAALPQCATSGGEWRRRSEPVSTAARLLGRVLTTAPVSGFAA
jgi:hypothetical protein